MPAPAFAADAATEKSYLESRRAAAREQRPPAQSQLTQALQQATAAPVETSGAAACKQEPRHAPAPSPSAPPGSSSSLGRDMPTTALQRLRPGTQRVPPRVGSDSVITPGPGLVGTWSSTTLSTSCDMVCGTTPPLVTGSLTLDFTGKFTALPPLPCCLRGGLAGSSAGVLTAAGGDSSSPSTGGLLPLRKSQSASELGGSRFTPGSCGSLQQSGLWLSTPEDRAHEGGPCSAAERAAKLARYRAKRARRNFQPAIMYASRKALADSRPRVGGRFARSSRSNAGGGSAEAGAQALVDGSAAGNAQDLPTPEQQQQQDAEGRDQGQLASSPSSSACDAAPGVPTSLGGLAGSSSSGRGSSAPAAAPAVAAAAPAVAAAAALLPSAKPGSKQWAGPRRSNRLENDHGTGAAAAAAEPPEAAATVVGGWESADKADATAAADTPPTAPPAAAGGSGKGNPPAGSDAHLPGAEDMDVDLPPAATSAEPESLGCNNAPMAAAAAAAQGAAEGPTAPGVAAGAGEGPGGCSQATEQAHTAPEVAYAVTTGLGGPALQAAPDAAVTSPHSGMVDGAQPATTAAPWLAQQQLQHVPMVSGQEDEPQQQTQEQAPKLRRCGLSGTFSQLRMQGWQAAAESPPTPAASGGHDSSGHQREEGVTPFSQSLPAHWMGGSKDSGSRCHPGSGGGGGSGRLAGSYSSGRLLGSGMKRGSFCLAFDNGWGLEEGAPEQQLVARTFSSSRGVGQNNSASPTSGQASAAAPAPVPCAWAGELLVEPPVTSAAPGVPWDGSQLLAVDVGMQWQDAPGQGALGDAQADTYTPGMHSQAGGGGFVPEHPAASAWGPPASPFAGCALEEGCWDAPAAAAGGDVLVTAAGSSKGGLKGTFGSFSTLQDAAASAGAAGFGGGPDDADTLISSSGPCTNAGVGAASPAAVTALPAAADCDFIQDGCLLAAAAAATGEVDELEQALMAFPLAAFDRVLPLIPF